MTVTLANTPVLQTDRLTLRAPQAGDWPAFHAFMQADRSTFLRDGAPMEDGKIWRSFCHVVGSWVLRGYGSFVSTERGSNAPLGFVGPWHPIDWPEPEIAWMILADAAEGRGYAFEAAVAARDHAFRHLGWTTAVSYIDPENARSIALAERLGAVRDDVAPRLPGSETCLVYRHPAPQAQS